MSLQGPRITLLDGPMGTLLLARGASFMAPSWSATSLLLAPDMVGQIHADYVAAGATVHTACTFRTRRGSVPDWKAYTQTAVSIARKRVPVGQRLAGSLGPLEDCYRPDLSPEDPRPEHREMARQLAKEGVDMLLCETFPHVGEGLIAVEEAVATGLPVWIAFTAGPEGELLTPEAMAEGAREAALRGASAVLVNCTAARLTLRYVETLARVCGRAGVPFGAYANSGDAPEDFNRRVDDPEAIARYVAHAATWVEAGATIVGSCCGTGPGHIAALARL